MKAKHDHLEPPITRASDEYGFVWKQWTHRSQTFGIVDGAQWLENESAKLASKYNKSAARAKARATTLDEKSYTIHGLLEFCNH